ncbi:MAG TPA: AAA domain-containing protein [Castellaniella sp.]|uniref:DEAD/DEAH box helicase n=1 Tax=Castellaniella sp. TaxID=1955812 RepID=UPI002EE2A868
MRQKLKLSVSPRSEFLTKFGSSIKQVKAAEKKNGTPALRLGIDENGTQLLIKTWPHVPGAGDTDLREIWHHEIRQLNRILGTRGVGDIIAELEESHVDEQGYHLTIRTEQRQPLESILRKNERLQHATRFSVNGRHLLWANFLRLAKGLDLLHLQGLLHRNLNTWSVLTADTNEPDFQLTGFEWSMRIVGLNASDKSYAPGTQGSHYSFSRDWHALGELAVKLFDINPARITNTTIPIYEVAENLTAAEARLIRQLLQILPTQQLYGKVVIAAIEKIIMSLQAAIQREELLYHLVVPVVSNNTLVDDIREASDYQIEAGDENAQLEFIENDLTNPTALLLSDDRLAIRGSLLTYYLQDFRRTREKIPSNWEVAYCASTSITRNSSPNPVNARPLLANALQLTPLSKSKTMFRGRARGTSWRTLRAQLKPTRQADARASNLYRALALTQMLDYALAASDVFPVKLVGNSRIDNHSGQHQITLESRHDDELDKLSQALELKDPPATRLREMLTSDKTADDRKTNWWLSSVPTIGDRQANPNEWQFRQEAAGPRGEQQYLFIGENPPPAGPEFFLVPSDSTGRDSQLERRIKSLAVLGEHRELSRMLIDPRRRVIDSNESVNVDDGFSELDASKQVALRKIVGTLPLFMLQGPPGVGKTRLVRELVRQRLEVDQTTRMLLTAQSHHAVDHLLHEVVGALSQEVSEDAVVIRCTTPDRMDTHNRFDVSNQTKNLLAGLRTSALCRDASEALQNKVHSLCATFELEGTEGTQQAAPNAKRALESLMLQSANLLFATANSGDIQGLIEDRSQFDWTIVEEAGKATGMELIAPMLLSPRRLMIGDHRQLPPFGEERTLSLLERPTAVKKALEMIDPIVGRALRGSIVDEVFNDLRVQDDQFDQNEFVKLCQDAGNLFSLFSSSIQQEYSRLERNPKSRPIAAALTHQHRMHPAIAAVVSHAFYEDKLLTDPQAAERFTQQPSLLAWEESAKLPDQPIIWVDVPWVQKTKLMKNGESFPRFTNQLELQACRRIIEAARTSTFNMPTMAVLSPYSRQVRGLAESLGEGTAHSELSKFRLPPGHKAYCNTVDSFQGSEADLVVISLVRNNGYGAVRAALGFLADERRMNVLLSRARYRMIIVGSLDFLRGISSNPQDRKEDIGFINRILEFFDDKNPNEFVTVVPVDQLGVTP